MSDGFDWYYSGHVEEECDHRLHTIDLILSPLLSESGWAHTLKSADGRAGEVNLTGFITLRFLNPIVWILRDFKHEVGHACND